MLKFYQRIKPDLSDLYFVTKTGSLSRSLSFGQHQVSPQRREEQSRIEKISASNSWHFFLFFFVSIVHFVVHKNAQMTFKLNSQTVSTVSDMKIKKATGYPVLALVIHLTQQGCIFSTRPGDNSTCLPQNRHSGFPAGEDRNLPDSGT